MDKISFKPGDKFILELGERRLDEYEIAGTDLYVKIYLLKKLTPYNPEVSSFVKTDLTVKVIEHDASITVTDGYKYHRSEYLCGACKKKVLGGDEYCSHCGTKLDWSGNERN